MKNSSALRLHWSFVATVLVSFGCVWFFWESPTPDPEPPAINVAEALGGSDVEGFARALEPRPFLFPQDHGAHPDFRNEWWYFTGNLRTPNDRDFGYQLTLFRNALAPTDSSASGSSWRSPQLFMGHLALTDLAAEKFHHSERFQRGALELAGATTEPLRIWLEDWEIKGIGESPLHWKLTALTEDFGLKLDVMAVKPMVLQGNNGLSQKGSQAGNASYYYSYTRLQTTGTIITPQGEFAVSGSSWLDREWSTSVLEENQVGWDWFSLQLEDGSDLMYYQLRDEEGKPDQNSSGRWVEASGSNRALTGADVQLTTIRTWQSPHTGAIYPAGWELKLPSEELKLRIAPRLADQELQVAVAYWEGSVSVEGELRGRKINGVGYVEMTGYDRQALQARR